MKIGRNKKTTQRTADLAGTLEFLSGEVQEELMVATDLAIALNDERRRLNGIALASNDEVPLEEIRVTYALLDVLDHKFSRLSEKVKRARSLFHQEMLENDLCPSRAETWARCGSKG